MGQILYYTLVSLAIFAGDFYLYKKNAKAKKTAKRELGVYISLLMLALIIAIVYYIDPYQDSLIRDFFELINVKT